MGRKFLFLVLVIPLYSQIQETVITNQPEIAEQQYFVADTLVLTDQSSPKRVFTTKRLLAMGFVMASGASVYYFHQQAEASYLSYQRSGSISEMNRLYDQAVKYDRAVGVSFLGLELGIAVLIRSFLNDT